MVKKQLGGLTSLFSSSKLDSASSSDGAGLQCPSSTSSRLSASSSAWQWPSCGHPRTLSFRQQQQQQEQEVDAGDRHHHHYQQHMLMMKQAYYKTMNSAYFPDSGGSCFSNSFASVDSFSSAAAASEAEAEAEAETAVIRALRSDRLLFEPDYAPSSSCILNKQANVTTKMKAENDEDDDDKKNTIVTTTTAFGGATAMSVESQNPYRDFRASMEAMVMSHGSVVKDWRWLEEMLGWYLRANGKATHALIVGAFVDLLVALSTSSPAPSSSPATPTIICCSSSSSTACSSSSLL